VVKRGDDDAARHETNKVFHPVPTLEAAKASCKYEPLMTSNVPSSKPRLVVAMALIKVQPTQFDQDVARGIARRTDVPLENVARVLTWGADEHLIVAAATLSWLLTRTSREPVRRLSTHVLICSLSSAILPHILKTIFEQQRPDRRTIVGHWRGAPLSGNPEDAFPSGHALHVGALASAATLFPPKTRNLLWAAGGFLVATRVVLLAHWVSDVLAGLGLGVALERCIRGMTKPVPICRWQPAKERKGAGAGGRKAQADQSHDDICYHLRTGSDSR
jgi:membrane-associated phospholipid phosphatase